MLHHVSLGVRDLALSGGFYDAALGALGFRRVFEDKTAIGYGLVDGKDLLCLKLRPDADAPGPGFHLAFAAPSRSAVDAFHQSALRVGGSDNGAPGLRPGYGQNYYAAFLVDPDGHRVEAVINAQRQPELSIAGIYLVPLTPPEFEAYMAHAVPAYAREKVESGQWAGGESLDLARKEVERVLPQGLTTPDHHLFSIRNETEADGVGMVWIAAQERAGKKIAYIYDVWIREEHRRKGYATQAFTALEKVVRQLGLSGISLHVFGHNTAAQALYRKLGYKATNIVMFKEIVDD